MEFILVNLSAECLTIVLSWYILFRSLKMRKNSSTLWRFSNYTSAMAAFTIINLCTRMGDEHIAFQSKPGGFIVNFLYMIVICGGSFNWYMYEEDVWKARWFENKRIKYMSYIPIAIFVFLSLCSWKTGWIFSISETGTYSRGSMWYLQFIFAYSFMLIAIVKTLYQMSVRRNEKGKTHRALTFNSLILLVGCALQIVFGLSFIAISATIGMVISYIELATPEEREILEQEALKDLLEKTQKQKIELQIALDNFKQADYDRRTDFLTGLRNRQDMFEFLKDTLSGKRDMITAMYMMDIDNFKRLNDRYGHTYGDECLQRIGAALKKYGEKNQIYFYRYGGEEMLGIGVGSKEDARHHADALVELVAGLKIVRDDTERGVVTVSLGYTTNNNRYEKMIDRADAAMYRAKDTGKDQWVCFENMEKEV